MQKNPLQSILNVIIVALLLLSGQVTFAQSSAPSWMGIVTYVTDGDTLWVQSIDHSTWHRLRILGIDAPEICQPWGSEARQTLTALVAGCQLEIIEFGLDVYGRWLGRLHIGSIDVAMDGGARSRLVLLLSESIEPLQATRVDCKKFKTRIVCFI